MRREDRTMRRGTGSREASVGFLRATSSRLFDFVVPRMRLVRTRVRTLLKLREYRGELGPGAAGAFGGAATSSRGDFAVGPLRLAVGQRIG